MKILNSIKCFFGLHDWNYKMSLDGETRECSRCDLTMQKTYDPMYGTTDWYRG